MYPHVYSRVGTNTWRKNSDSQVYVSISMHLERTLYSESRFLDPYVAVPLHENIQYPSRSVSFCNFLIPKSIFPNPWSHP